MTEFHTIIGMPGSGKTTFLAAFWHLITSGELDPSLVLDRLEGDHHYLNTIAETWQRCERLPRTPMTEDNTVAIHLKDVATGRYSIMSFADLSGETFHRQFATRRCSPEYVAGLNGSGGLMLFVNADRPLDAVTILDMQGLLHGQDEQARTEWSPHLVSEQAQLVDLLQCMQRAPFLTQKRRIAVLISAWDIIENETLTPEKWLRTEMPFLDQFLGSNPDSFCVRVYGVSAQGGIIDESSRKLLLGKIASERIRCVSGSSSSSDITLPLKWLSEVDNE